MKQRTDILKKKGEDFNASFEKNDTARISRVLNYSNN